MRPGFREEIEYFHGLNHDDAPWAPTKSDVWSRSGTDRSRRRSRMFGTGELRLVLLKLVADAPRHGYDLIKAIEELTGGAYAPSSGAVYPTLQMLADEGAIVESEDEASSRKLYAATTQGQDELAKRDTEVRIVIERLVGIAEVGRSAPNMQVQRALENLRNAVRLRHHHSALEGDMLAAIVELLDETARRIERM